MRVSTLVVAFLLLAASHAAAQTATPPFEVSLRASAALELAAQRALAHRTAFKVADDVVAPRRRGKHEEGVTLMILGGAAVVVGAIAGGGGGTVLIVGGLVCAGYGVYLYTQ
jgi:predicted phage tail protein